MWLKLKNSKHIIYGRDSFNKHNYNDTNKSEKEKERRKEKKWKEFQLDHFYLLDLFYYLEDFLIIIK